MSETNDVRVTRDDERPSSPLKAERIQRTLEIVPPRPTAYGDLEKETAAESDACLEAGCRKRTVESTRRSRRRCA